MNNRYTKNTCVTLLWPVLLLPYPARADSAQYLDIAPFAQLSSWTGAAPHRLAGASSAGRTDNLGLEWDEERDVRELLVRYQGAAPTGAVVEYWNNGWPWDPPKMPSIEDPMDDPWQGKWLKAAVRESCEGSVCRYDFRPLETEENPRADRLPGVAYRRTLKVRVRWPGAPVNVSRIAAFSGTGIVSLRLRVEVAGVGGTLGEERFSVYNGLLSSVTPFQGGAVVEVSAAKPSLPGSHDLTIITVAATHRFSFSTSDLASGPIVIPPFGVRITDMDHPGAAAPVGRRIRERIRQEPEQTYERATREIPPLDPWEREWAGQLYLPLAADSSWQKFAFEIGGNVFISKTGTKAKGRELARLRWSGDRITWKIGTGEKPYYREDHKVTIRKLDGCLPVGIQEWDSEGLHYTEEAFATLLRGPLAPEDPGRNEETSAVLMLRLSARSAGAGGTAHVVISDDPAESLTLDGHLVSAGAQVRAAIEGGNVSAEGGAIRASFSVPAGGESALVLKVPFVSDLSAADAADLERLDYATERARVVQYWTHLVDAGRRFSVPEPKFNDLTRSVVAQIHISAAKDPGTGLYILPAASYAYDVFWNEACYQALLLDTLGQKDDAARFLETIMRLQGSRNFPGLQTGPPDGIFHGAKISDTYDYTMSGYGLDHGTVLWTLAQHYLYTRDRQWLEHAWPHMKKAIDWIEQQRAANKITDIHGQKVRWYGLLPACQLEDNPDWANWFVIDAYAWAGMARTAEALADIGSPEAERVRRQADDYLRDIRDDIRRAIESAPVVRMQDGAYEPYVPVTPTRRFRIFGPIRRDYYQRYGQPADVNPLMRLGADRDTLCGPVLFLFLGVFDVHEPIANWILDDWEDNETLSSGMGMNVHGMTDDRYWFSQGGMVFQANLVNPVPAYLRLHETSAAIRDLYNDFVACFYPQVNVFTEEFHQWRHGSGPFYKTPDEARFTHRLRDTLALEDGDTLWLAPGAPRRWLASSDGIRVDRLQTFFGPVSYNLHAGSETGVIEGEVTLPNVRAPKTAWLVVRPPSGRIQSVTLDGKPWTKIDRALEAVELPASAAPMRIEVRYR